MSLKHPFTAPVQGIDVSKYQGKIDWPKVRAAGYAFALIRLGWANGDGSIVLDEYYTRNMEGAAAAGLDVGVYLYSYLESETGARIAAARVLELVRPYTLTMPVVLDYEHGSKYASYGRAKNTAICNAFLRVIAAAGLLPMYYSYTSFCAAYMNMAALEQYEGLWIANYTGKIGVDNAAIWQYTSSGNVPGILGRCDLNRMYCDLPRTIRESYTPGKVEWQPITGKLLDVFGRNKNCEWFKAASIHEVGGVLTVDKQYKVLTLAGGLVNGYPMCTVELEDRVVYVALLDDRCRLVDAPPEKPPLGEYDYMYKVVPTGWASAGDRKSVCELYDRLGLAYSVEKIEK